MVQVQDMGELADRHARPGYVPVADQAPDDQEERVKWPARWPLILIALPAGVATWSGWVGIGELTGFGPMRILPGILDDFVVNTAVTLPIGVEIYAAYSMSVWLSAAPFSTKTRRYAKISALASLLLGMLGQIAYHLLASEGKATAPWQITTVVSCLPVVVVGLAAGLYHSVQHDKATVRSAARAAQHAAQHDAAPVAVLRREPSREVPPAALAGDAAAQHSSATPSLSAPATPAQQNAARAAQQREPQHEAPVTAEVEPGVAAQHDALTVVPQQVQHSAAQTAQQDPEDDPDGPGSGSRAAQHNDLEQRYAADAGELAALGSNAARVRAAVVALGADATVDQVRTWLATRGVAANASLRTDVSRAKKALERNNNIVVTLQRVNRS